jgi:BirA family biotin operon repressor/biotin-[acetyl-CoA-carboxylase] ligase
MITYTHLSLPNTLFIGKVCWHFPKLESTNGYAQVLLSKTDPIEGTVISTYNQTAGRGQIGRTWESAPNQNLTLSVILFPHFLIPKQQFLLTKITALAVRDVVASYVSSDVFIKWPNDIYIKDKKTSGILIQNTLSSKSIQSTIIGIGLNVNQTEFSDQLPNPTSLQLASQQSYDLDTIRTALCVALEQRFLQLRRSEWQQIHEEYLMHFYQLNELAAYESSDGEQFKGIIRGVADNGQLQIEHNGRIRHFDIKAIRYR